MGEEEKELFKAVMLQRLDELASGEGGDEDIKKAKEITQTLDKIGIEYEIDFSTSAKLGLPFKQPKRTEEVEPSFVIDHSKVPLDGLADPAASASVDFLFRSLQRLTTLYLAPECTGNLRTKVLYELEAVVDTLSKVRRVYIGEQAGGS